MKVYHRIEKLRTLLSYENIDAIIVRSITDLMWLTGFEYVFDSEQAHVAVITQDECVLHTDMRYSTAMRKAAQNESLWEIDDSTERISAFVAKVLQRNALQNAHVAINKDTPLSLYRSLTERLKDVKFLERDDDIFLLRSQKDTFEIEKIKFAQSCAERAFLELLETLRPGQSERDVSLMLEFALRRCGADELSFPNIVASGPNSANPHAVPSDRKLQMGDFVVFDFGARVNGYCSDTTRTVCLGKPSDEQIHIYDAVRLANEEVEKSLKAGVRSKDMHNLAEQILADAGYAGKMGHALGHGVGLDVHELPVLSPRSDDKLKESSIVTVEPGIYISGENGVRLEDFGCVTVSSFDNFCQLPHDMYILE